MYPPRPVPVVERLIQQPGFYAHQAIANDRCAGYQVAAFLAPTAEAFARLLPQVISPLGDGLVAAPPAQDSASGDAQHHRQAMAPPLGTARVGNGIKAQRQRAHLFGVEHDLGGSGEL